MTQERHIFSDVQWQCIEPSMPPCKGRPGGAYRAFFDALLLIARTGSPWRDLPERLGKWNVVYQRYAYWCKKGHFERLFQGVQQPDMEEVMVDSTCCRAHQSSGRSEENQRLAGHRHHVRRAQHQNPRRVRRAGQPAALCADRRPASRLQTRARTAGWAAGQGAFG